MKYHLQQHGSALVILVMMMVIVFALGAAIVSMRTASSHTQINAGTGNLAYYLAESGKRYADFPNADGTGTVGKTYRLSDGNEFQLAIASDSSFSSSGTVYKDSAFESIRKISGLRKNGMPCWNFDNSFKRGQDVCGLNDGMVNIATAVTGRFGDAMQFNGSSWIDTPFKPIAEIGNGKPFSISFWAKPQVLTNQMVLGVFDAAYRFSVGIRSGKWYWAYGNKDTQTIIDAVINQWQQVTLVYTVTSVDNKLTMYVSGCSLQTSTYDYAASLGTAILPTDVKNLFIGGENTGGAMPNLPFTGLIDEVKIYDRALTMTEISPPCDVVCNAVAYYPFNGDANDASGHLLNGNSDPAAGGGPVKASNRFSCSDTAYTFDGSDDYLYVSDNNLLDLSTTGTLAAWIYISNFKEYAGIIHKGDDVAFSDEAYSLKFGLGSDQQKILFILNATDTITSTVNLGINTWYHLVATWDSIGMKLYIDGKPDNSNSVTGISAKNSTGNLNIGAQLPAGQHYMDTSVSPSVDLGNFPFDGKIDDVLIFNRALSDAEVAALAADKP